MSAARILIINDDESILELFQMILESEGFQAAASLETIENLTEVERIQPDLIILDLKMGMQQEGWVMMQKLRMYPPTKEIPIILCTAALNEVQEQEDTLHDKGIPVIYKPFDTDELLKVVRNMLPASKAEKKKKIH